MTVLWAEAAVRDLEDIVHFIALDSVDNAERTLDRIRSRASSLEVAPQSGRIVPELRHLGVMSFRELVIKPYRLVYHVSEERVVVLGLFDGRRDFEDLLFERLLR